MENKRVIQLKEFLAQTPADPFLNYALAIEYVGMNNDAEARKLLESLRENNPEYTATYYHLGKLYEREGNKTAAEETYREGIIITMKNREQHALAELQNALTNMMIDEDE